MERTSAEAYHDAPTFKQAESTYDWIKGMEKAVDWGLMRKEAMEQAVKSVIKK